MLNHELTFNAPWWLFLLALVPAIWMISWRSLAGLGPGRRVLALSLRSLVVVLLVLALAEARLVRANDRLTVLYLLDQSLSLPAAQRHAMFDYVNAAVERHRKRDDRVGVIVFGREAAVEIPPFAGEPRMAAEMENVLDPEHTNLADALRLASACFPEDAARRIVVVSDGNENLGDAMKEARIISRAGVGIDVVPVHFPARREVVVERLSLPGNVRRGQPFDLRVVVDHLTDSSEGGDARTRGRLVLSRAAGDYSETLSEETIALPPGKSVFTVRQRIEEPGFFTYEARFVPDHRDEDGSPQNNRATAFAHVHGKGRVLLIEDFEHRGEFNRLVGQLRGEGLEVTVQPGDQSFSNLAELQAYDVVILANVPREQFTENQIAMLSRNTQQLGAGLVMLGGPNSFGAGGWTGTEVEKAMPVDFQIKSAKVVPIGALALVIDRSGSMAGEKVALCKKAAMASVKTLGQRDYVGVVAFHSAARWVVPMTRAGAREAIIRRIGRIGAGGGTNMHPGMTLGHAGLGKTKASMKHMIVLSDGQTMGEGYGPLAGQIRKGGITISTVAVGPDADIALLNRIASIGGGKFYRVQNPRVLPRIFMKEARRVARPLIFDQYPVRPRINYPHEILGGIESPLPAIQGFVLTSKKHNPLVEVALVSPKPAGEENGTILASWHYGLGRAVAFTSDAGARWAGDWIQDPACEKVYAQIVRWAMRPSAQSGRFTVATDVDADRVRVIVNALDKDDAFLNFLALSGSAVGPELQSIPFSLEQTAPGRYVGSFPTPDAGSYFLVIHPGMAQSAPICHGVNVPCGDEFRTRSTNEALLRQLANLAPRGGASGQVVETPMQTASLEPLLAVNPFRHAGLPKATDSQHIWHLAILLLAWLFFADILVRRVHIQLAWVGPMLGRARDRVLRRESAPATPVLIERLQSRKAEIQKKWDDHRAAARFSGTLENPMEDASEETPPARSTKPLSPLPAAPDEEEKPVEESYTERLLRAKHKVWRKGE